MRLEERINKEQDELNERYKQEKIDEGNTKNMYIESAYRGHNDKQNNLIKLREEIFNKDLRDKTPTVTTEETTESSTNDGESYTDIDKRKLLLITKGMKGETSMPELITLPESKYGKG